MPKRHLVNHCLALFLRQYLYLRSISTFGDVNALCDQTPVPICTFKMVEIQLLSFSLRQYSFFSDHEAGGKDDEEIADRCLRIASVCFHVKCLFQWKSKVMQCWATALPAVQLISVNAQKISFRRVLCHSVPLWVGQTIFTNMLGENLEKSDNCEVSFW